MNTNFSVELFFPWKYVLLNVKQLNSLWLQNSNAKSLIPTLIFFYETTTIEKILNVNRLYYNFR